MIILLIATFVGIALFEAPGLVQKKYWRELAVFLSLLSFAFIIALLQVLGVNLPNPTKGIELLVRYLLALFS